MPGIIIKPKNKKEEKQVKAFLAKHDIEYEEVEEKSVLEEEEVVYQTRQMSKSGAKNKAKEKLVAEIKQSVKELNLIKQGKLKAKSAKDLLDEL